MTAQLFFSGWEINMILNLRYREQANFLRSHWLQAESFALGSATDHVWNTPLLPRVVPFRPSCTDHRCEGCTNCYKTLECLWNLLEVISSRVRILLYSLMYLAWRKYGNLDFGI